MTKGEFLSFSELLDMHVGVGKWAMRERADGVIWVWFEGRVLLRGLSKLDYELPGAYDIYFRSLNWWGRYVWKKRGWV